jgi:predicted secreted acid phosphatase
MQNERHPGFEYKVFPNPVDGDWERVLYSGNNPVLAEEKEGPDSVIDGV